MRVFFFYWKRFFLVVGACMCFLQYPLWRTCEKMRCRDNAVAPKAFFAKQQKRKRKKRNRQDTVEGVKVRHWGTSFFFSFFFHFFLVCSFVCLFDGCSKSDTILSRNAEWRHQRARCQKCSHASGDATLSCLWFLNQDWHHALFFFFLPICGVKQWHGGGS